MERIGSTTTDARTAEQSGCHSRPCGRASRAALLLTSALLAGTALAAAGCAGGEESGQAGPRVARGYAEELGVDLDAMTRRPDGLYVQDLKEGTGARVDSGDVVVVHYTGWLPNGTKFDSSHDRGRPLTDLAIGYGRVIDGWDRGLVGMRAGGHRRLVIPPELGYGATRNGPIPANSTLVFDVEVLEVENRTPERDDAAADSGAPATDPEAATGAVTEAATEGGSR